MDDFFLVDSTSQSRRNSNVAPLKPAVYKKRPAPVPAARDDIVRSASVEKSTVDPNLASAIGKLNPVKEMQIRGRTSNNEATVSRSGNKNLIVAVILICSICSIPG